MSALVTGELSFLRLTIRPSSLKLIDILPASIIISLRFEINLSSIIALLNAFVLISHHSFKCVGK